MTFVLLVALAPIFAYEVPFALTYGESIGTTAHELEKCLM